MRNEDELFEDLVFEEEERLYEFEANAFTIIFITASTLYGIKSFISDALNVIKLFLTS